MWSRRRAWPTSPSSSATPPTASSGSSFQNDRTLAAWGLRGWSLRSRQARGAPLSGSGLMATQRVEWVDFQKFQRRHVESLVPAWEPASWFSPTALCGACGGGHPCSASPPYSTPPPPVSEQLTKWGLLAKAADKERGTD